MPLRPHPTRSPLPGPLAIVVLDGIGLGRGGRGDAVALARRPTMRRLATGPATKLHAHGTWVGMPGDTDMGNSEVGHNALGAGRVFAQGAALVDAAFADGSVWVGEPWREIVEPCRGEQGAALHLIGLLSDGNVHSHERFVHAMVRRAAEEGCRRLYVHTLLDGRDVPDGSAGDYLDRLEGVLAPLRARGDFAVASGGGRMAVTMDRYESDWAVVERGWRAHVLGDGRRFPSAQTALSTFRTERPEISDQNLPPFVVERDGRPVATIEDGDSVVFFNFRGDRALQISRAFEQADFAPFDRVRVPAVRYAGMMQYDGDTQTPRRFLVSPPRIDRTMSELLAESSVSQWACAETQKFGHVTYFWNGNRSGRLPGETQVEIPSDRVPFEQRPWMKAAEVTDAAVAALEAETPPRLLRINYANGDMVGHTGNLDATVLAVEAVDLALGRLLAALARRGGGAIVTADHGNADEMLRWNRAKLDYDDLPVTSHSLNAVPCWLSSVPAQFGDIPDASLANVAATALELLGFEAPADYLPSLLAK